MSDSNAERGVTTLDLQLLARPAAAHHILRTIEALSVFIAPAHLDVGQRGHIQTALHRLVALILIEAETRAVERLGGVR